MIGPTLPIHLVDDDPAVLKALSRLLLSSGFEVHTYKSARDFIDQRDAAVPGCLVLDMSMPGLSGLELQECVRQFGCVPGRQCRKWLCFEMVVQRGKVTPRGIAAQELDHSGKKHEAEDQPPEKEKDDRAMVGPT